MVEQGGDKERKASEGAVDVDKVKGHRVESSGEDETAVGRCGEIEKLVSEKISEQRSLETLLLTHFSNLEKNIDRTIKFWGGLALVILTVLSFFGYQTIKSQVVSQVESKLISPEVENTVRSALENQTKDFVNDKINPLDQRIAEIKNDFAKLRSIAESISTIEKSVEELKGKLKVAESDVKEVLDENEILRLSYDARRGERSAFNKIMNFGTNVSSRRGALAKSLLDDLRLYFNDW